MTQRPPQPSCIAGGLGTRMSRATPKHFHPLLGRRMVDWVVEAARAVDADPLVVVTSPQGAGRASTGSRSPSRPSRAERATPLAARAAGSERGRRGRPGALRRHAAAQRRSSCASPARDPPARASAAATVLSFRPPDPRDYGRVIRGDDGSVRAIVEAARRRPRAARGRRGQLLDLRLRRRPGLARARAARHRTTRRVSCTSPTPCAVSSRMASVSSPTSHPTRPRPRA